MDDEELNDLLFSTSASRQLILNFMKGISLLGAAKQLATSKDSDKNSEIADSIMNDIIEGYQFEEHSVQ